MGEMIVKTKTHDVKVVTNDCENFDKIVLCLHGFNGNKWGDAYEGVKDILPNALVCSFDSVGHGKSPISSLDMTLECALDEMDEVIKYLKSKFNKKIIIVAVSYGGYRAIAYLNKYNPDIEKVVLINPALRMLEILEMTKNFKYSKLKDDDIVPMKQSKGKFMKKQFLDGLHECDLFKFDKLNYDITMVIGKKDNLIPRGDLLEFADKFNIPILYVDDDHCLSVFKSWEEVSREI